MFKILNIKLKDKKDEISFVGVSYKVKHFSKENIDMLIVYREDSGENIGIFNCTCIEWLYFSYEQNLVY